MTGGQIMKKNLELHAYLFHQGTSVRAYEFLGAHPYAEGKEKGFVFRVWAPKARTVYLIGDFNKWDYHKSPMERITEQGIWELYVPAIEEYTAYKYVIEDDHDNHFTKADPYGYHMETRPSTASKTYYLENYKWQDQKWMKNRKKTLPYGSPINIYEVHLGSWKRYSDGNYFDYRKIAEELIPYVKDMGYTHIELMPIAEHPFDGSWGYQILGFFAPTSRYGTPKDFMYFVDQCHKAEIGVIMDWVPGHFPKDEAGLYQFDGSSCYEYADPLKREHEEWGTMIFDWGRNEVRSFLTSNAFFWLDQYHIDGFRVDAVASMLYLNYNRNDGNWRPNKHGGRENLEAIAFFQELNTALFGEFPDILMIAEESTAWPLVTKPVDVGGLGFNFKWNMGWMNDTLQYMKTDPYFKKGVHNNLTFALTYIFSENFILPLSHDEVVHMKGSLINKMPGNYDEQFDNLRAYYGYMMAHPGKKLLFMGGELAQFDEWKFQGELDWGILEFEKHRKMQRFCKELNHFYLENSCLWELDHSWEGFKWIDPDDRDQNMLTFRRINGAGEDIIVICNFAPIKRIDYIVGVDRPGNYKLAFNSDGKKFGGAGGGTKRTTAKPIEFREYKNQIKVTVPPLSTIFYKNINGGD